MFELRSEEILESSDPYDSEDTMWEEAGGAEEAAEVTRALSADGKRFSRVQWEESPVVKGEAAPSIGPLHNYYRSMSKISLLTRAEEVYLAKTIETAKIDTLRWLSLTPITTARLMELASELQPVSSSQFAASTDNPEILQETGSEVSPDARNHERAQEIRRILQRLEKLEERYREIKLNMKSKGRPGGRRTEEPAKIKLRSPLRPNKLQEYAGFVSTN